MDQSHECNIPSNHRHHHGDDENTTNNNEAPTTSSTAKPVSFFLDNIIVGYAFGSKKMETMGLIMAEASKALSTFECAGTLPSMVNNKTHEEHHQHQNNNDAMEQLMEESSMATGSMTTAAAASMLTTSQVVESNKDNAEKESIAAAAASSRTHYFSDDNEEDTRSFSSTYTRSSFLSQRSSNQPRGGNGTNGVNGIQLTFLPDSSGFIHLVKTASSSGVGGGGESITGSSMTTTSATTATSLTPFRKLGVSSSAASCSSIPLSLSPSLMKERNEFPNLGLVSRRSNGSGGSGHSSTSMSTIGVGIQQQHHHPIRVSFVPIDLDTPLEEQHGGKFDVILHKMTEDILCMSKMLRSRGQNSGDHEQTTAAEDGCEIMQPPSTSAEAQPIIKPPAVDNHNPNDLFEATSSMTRHQARASRRIQRLLEYKQKAHPSCVLVDSPNNILAVMSRADMAEVLSRCLVGVTTKGGIPVRTPRFRVVEDDGNELSEIRNGSWESIQACSKDKSISSQGMAQDGQDKRHEKFAPWPSGIKNGHGKSISPLHHEQPTTASTLADEIESSGFEYPLIAKPLTAAGTKSSHHMGIVLARDGLQQLKTPCLLQEYANHGETLFKVYVLGESVWVFSRESLPNLPLGERMQQIYNNDRKRPRTTAESYVEFERPAGSRCYVEFNSQRPYPKLSDFGIVAAEAEADQKSSNVTMQDDQSKSTIGSDSNINSNGNRQCQDDVLSEQCHSMPRSKKQRLDVGLSFESCHHDKERQQQAAAAPPVKFNNKNTSTANNSKLARCVTAEEIEPVTTALREAFGLELFGFDVLVKHNHQNGSSRIGSSCDGDDDDEKEILVVDVNYFPGYKEVPNFPSLLAQYLTQKAVESRLRNNFDGPYRE